MLGHPAFVSAQIGGYAQSKALFAQQDVSAVTGVDGNNGVVLRELADISLFLVDVAFAVKSSTQSSLSPRTSRTALPTLVMIAMLSTT